MIGLLERLLCKLVGHSPYSLGYLGWQETGAISRCLSCGMYNIGGKIGGTWVKKTPTQREK